MEPSYHRRCVRLRGRGGSGLLPVMKPAEPPVGGNCRDGSSWRFSGPLPTPALAPSMQQVSCLRWKLHLLAVFASQASPPGPALHVGKSCSQVRGVSCGRTKQRPVWKAGQGVGLIKTNPRKRESWGVGTAQRGWAALVNTFPRPGLCPLLGAGIPLGPRSRQFTRQGPWLL